MPKISVIIPVYNASSYIKKCLDSLVKQTLSDIEIIIVNDGSVDNTEKIINNYLKKHNNIIYIYKENGGQSSARNLGLKKAKGKFISFIDGDDYIEEDMLEKLYNKAEEYKLDICICDIKYVYDDHIEKQILFKENKKIISPKEYMLTNPCPWNKIYKRTLLTKNNFAFPEGIIYEDFSMIPRLALWTDKIGYVNECLYNYIIHENSTMNINAYNSKINSIFKACDELYNYFLENDKIEEYYEELEHLYIHHLLYNAGLRFYSFKRYEELKKISNIMKEKFPNWKKSNCYKKFNSKDKIIMNIFYYNQIWLLNLITGIKRRFK